MITPFVGHFVTVKGRTIRKLMGGGGGKYKKNIRAREN